MKTTIFSILLLMVSGLFAQKDYKGAEVYSNDAWKYGKIEMRMRMAKGSGILSTFFTYKNGSEISGTFWEEIDIEVFGKDNAETFQSNIITNYPKRYSEQIHSPGYSMADDYHTYILEWTPNYVAWYIDGVLMRKSEGGQVNELTNTQSFRFNLWAANIVEWVGEFDTSVLPVYQFVNWIKYSSYTPGAGDNGTDFTLSWTDNFDTFNTTRWSKANWTFSENLVDFDPNNVVVRDGYLVLVLSRAGQTGFNGTIPQDAETQSIPSVTISTPIQDAIFCSTQTINITADASISSGSITKIDFYDGNNLLGTDFSAPYTFSINNLSSGTKTIRAIATSNAGIVSSPATISITINSPTEITPNIQVNGGDWLQESTIDICEGTTIKFGPHPNTLNTWTWSGPNNYTASNREIEITNISNNNSGLYIVTYNDGICESSLEYSLAVNPIPNLPIVESPIVYNQDDEASPLTAQGEGLKWYTSITQVLGSTNAAIPSTTTIGSTSYFVSQTIDGCESDKAEIVVNVNASITEKIYLRAGWNIIGYPNTGEEEIEQALSSIWEYVEVVKNLESYYVKSNLEFLNTLNNLKWGEGYFIKVNADCELDWNL